MLDEEIGSSRVCGAALICITGTWMADIFARHPPITDSGFSYASERRNCQKSIPPPIVDSFGYMRAFPNGAVVVWTFRSRRQFGGLHSKNVQLSSLAQTSQTSQPWSAASQTTTTKHTYRRPPLISRGHYDGRCLSRPPASRSHLDSPTSDPASLAFPRSTPSHAGRVSTLDPDFLGDRSCRAGISSAMLIVAGLIFTVGVVQPRVCLKLWLCRPSARGGGV